MPARAPAPHDLQAGTPRHIVFSHGNGFPGATYTLMFDALRRRGFSVAAIDQYGHDPRYPVTDNWPHLVEQLRDFAMGEVKAKGGKVWLVGHSLGGMLSLMCGALHPEVTCGIVMLDSPIVAGWRAGALSVAKRTALVGSVSPGATSRRRREHWASRDAAIEHFRHKRAFARWHPKALEHYVDHGTRRDGTDGERVLAFNRDVETAIYNSLPHNLEALLRRHPLKVPAAFVGGTRSKELRQVGLALTQKVTRGRVTMLEGSHLFPMEMPLVTAAAVELAVMELDAG